MSIEQWSGRGADVEKVIQAIKREVANAVTAAPDLKLIEFELEVSVVSKKESSGTAGFTFKVPFLGDIGPTAKASNATEGTTKLSLTYKAPKAPEVEMFDIDLSGLAGALSTMQEAIHAADRSEPRLPFDEGEVSFAFAVTNETEAGVKLAFLEGTRTGSRADEQTITLKFARK
jgi:hypothetical protein